MLRNTSYYSRSFFWGVISKIIDALVKFITIPLLLQYFGKENYGILTLAIATNAYMHILDLGINTGAIKYFSQWISEKNTELIEKVARSSLTFYFYIGLLNSLLLIGLGIWGESLFNVTHEQFKILKLLFFSLSIYTIINWTSSVFRQLLIANEKIEYIQKINVAKTILQLLLVLSVIFYTMSIYEYFIYFLLIDIIIIIPFLHHAYSYKFITKFSPYFNWESFKPVFKYSIAIFAMGIFQMTATQSRPIILGIFSTQGIDILAEYRIIEVFPLFVISIGGMITSILLPKSSKFIHANNTEKISKLAYQGTFITSIIVCFLTIPIIIVSKEILTLYVGIEYAFLSKWLILWLLTILLYLHNSPVASLVLASGKTKMLVYSSAISCLLSIILNAVLTSWFGVGSAVIGYLLYIIIQMSFYYFYFNNKVLHLQSKKIFRSFVVPSVLGIFVAIPIYYMQFQMPLYTIIFLKITLWIILYSVIVYLFNIGNIKHEIMIVRK